MMQQALPYRIWLPNTENDDGMSAVDHHDPTEEKLVNETESVRKLVSENAVMVFARKGCCMCHVVKLLLHGHGVNPRIFDVDEENEADVANELSEIVGVLEDNSSSPPPPFPAVFVGGELFGGLEEIMGAHISGELVPKLRQARALWL